MSDLTMPVSYTEPKTGTRFDLIIVIEDYDYYPEEKETGPSYASGGNPGAPAYVEVNTGYVKELDGDMGDLSTYEMCVLSTLSSDESGFFHAVVDANAEEIEIRIMEHEEEMRAADAIDRAEYLMMER